MRITTLIVLVGVLFSRASFSATFEKKYYRIIKDIEWAADKAEVPFPLLLGVCWSESHFDTQHSTHMDGHSLSYNICQIKLETAKDMDKYWGHKVLATPERLEVPKINAFYAAKYLKKKLIDYNGDWLLAVDAYNKDTPSGRDTRYVQQFVKGYKHLSEHIAYIPDADSIISTQ